MLTKKRNRKPSQMNNTHLTLSTSKIEQANDGSQGKFKHTLLVVTGATKIVTNSCDFSRQNIIVHTMLY
jgi:predicted SpoU family rRNA methylase